GYGEVFDFALPNDAVVCDDWLRFGAHEDWFQLPLGWFSFPFGSNVVNALTVLSSGSLYPAITNASTFIAPLKASLGIVPMANWGLLPNNSNSCFWHCFTPSNTVVFTWQNVLLERDADKPVSFQCEISQNGDMMFRYDLSNLTENPTTNVLVGLSNGRYERLYSALSNSITSLKWSHLDSNDYLIPDRDGDGLSTADEIFVYRTDPGNPDTDMDGLSDGEEILKGSHPLSQDTDGDIFPDGTDPRPSECDLWDDNDGDFLPDSWKEHWFGTNSISAADDTNCDGVPNIASLMIGMNPVCQSDDGFAVPCGSFAPEINAWEIIPTSFSSACPQSVTDLIVRTYTIARNSPWEQFFISARPDRAKGWAMSGMELLYGTDGEPVTNAVPASSSDSLRLDFGESMPQTVTVRLVTKGSHVSLSSPLYLLRWTPKVEFASSPFVHIVNSTNGHVYAAGKRDPATGLYSIPYSLDTGKYPHDGGMDSCTALDLSLPPVYGISVTNIPAQAFTATDPVLVDLPREGMNLSKRILCYSVSFENATAVDSGPRASKYDSPYPLDRRSLRVAYHEASDKESKSSVALVLKPSVPELSFRKAATKTVRSMPLARTGGDDDGYEFFPPFSGWPEVGGDPCTNDTYDVDFEYPENHDSTYPEEDEEDEDDDCECGCDGSSSLGSFRLRIPLGESAHNEISGFLWTSINGPAEVSPELFNVLSAPGITVVTNSDRSIEVVNTRLGGKSLSVTNIANGVDIPVWDANGKFEARWEVVNEDGNIDSFRVRKMTVLGNATEDVTYRVWEEYSPEVFGDVPEDLPVVVWERVDNLRGLSKRRYELRDEYESDFVLKQYEETYLDGNLIRAVLTDYI
ncbi:MAG: hypothetical protein IJV91_09200, partial [Kiritimatiellae bacterium]|nr:hypothetical protein [Kiritimatiellia bacterium]